MSMRAIFARGRGTRSRRRAVMSAATAFGSVILQVQLDEWSVLDVRDESTVGRVPLRRPQDSDVHIATELPGGDVGLSADLVHRAGPDDQRAGVLGQ